LVNIHSLVAEIEAKVAAMPLRNAAALRALRRQYSKQIANASGQDAVKLAASLIGRGRVHRFVGDELIASHTRALFSLDRQQLEQLGAGMSSWDQVDSFASYLSGPAWREGCINDDAIVAWANSPDRWWRRAALVSTVPLNVKARGGRGDAPHTLKICSLLLHDRDEMVVKALSWALRSLAVRDPHSVRLYLEQHDTALPALVRREVRNKLATGLKNPSAKKHLLS
jgi:3-methyladenine DNA glycosylase AlkD